jgi:hypothetical protein
MLFVNVLDTRMGARAYHDFSMSRSSQGVVRSSQLIPLNQSLIMRQIRIQFYCRQPFIDLNPRTWTSACPRYIDHLLSRDFMIDLNSASRSGVRCCLKAHPERT